MPPVPPTAPEPSILLVSAIAAIVFAVIHVAIGRLRFLDAVPRSRWLSFAGGVAVAYIFLHVLPELSRRREHLDTGIEVLAEHSTYLIALLGLVAFYGLERAIKTSGKASMASGFSVFALHIGSFALYSFLIGYLLLHREEPGLVSLLIYAVAMALHFLTNDVGLRHHHQATYDRIARWVLAAAVVLGWLAGLVLTVSMTVVTGLFALLAGGVVLNVLKEELPEERQSRFWPFLGGVGGYAVLLLLAA